MSTQTTAPNTDADARAMLLTGLDEYHNYRAFLGEPASALWPLSDDTDIAAVLSDEGAA